MYLYMDKNQIDRPGGGGVKALADASAKNASFFFDVFPGL